MSKILGVDKVTFQASPLADNQKFTSANYNEIKQVVNDNDDELQGKLSDAPSDGNEYGRKDGAWTILSFPTITGASGELIVSDGSGNGAGDPALTYDSANNILNLSKNLTQTAALLNNNAAIGVDHTFNAPTSAIRWCQIIGEGHTMESLDTTTGDRVANSFILGGFNSVMRFNEGSNGLFGSGIFGSFNLLEAPFGENMNSAFAMGRNLSVLKTAGHAFGMYGTVTGIGGIVFGHKGDGTGLNLDSAAPDVFSGGRHAINMSANTAAQGVGHGAFGDFSGVFGGIDADIPLTSDYSTTIGGEGIKATAGVTHTAHLPKLRLGQGLNATLPTGDNVMKVLVIDSVTGEVHQVDQSVIGT